MQTGNEPKQNSAAAPDVEHDEISRVARELWRSRKPGDAGSAENDWYRAAEIVRARKQGGGNIASGNTPAQSESYVGGAGNSRAKTSFSTERSQDMENTT